MAKKEERTGSYRFAIDHWDKENYALLLDELHRLAEPDFQKFHSGLVPGEEKILGVRTPELRRISREISAGNRREFLELGCGDIYEEKVLYGMVTAGGKEALRQRMADISRFVPKIDSWAVCDIFCSSLKCIKGDKAAYWGFITGFLLSENEFELRFPLVVLLGYYVDEEYLERVLDIYDTVRHEGYYVRMAVAWGISVCFAKFPEQTLRYLKGCSLDSFTLNKTIQKCIESYRISPDMKKELRTMRSERKRNSPETHR